MAENNEEKEILEREDVDSSNENITDETVQGDTQTQKEEEPEEEKKVPTVEDELREFKDKYLRLYSEFENFRRRTAKEKLELMTTASEGVILDMLPVIDDFERAEKALEENDDVATIKEGTTLIINKFKKILTDKGLKPIETKGETFDVDLHEAITQFPAPSDDLKGKIMDETEKGYYLGEKVIRFSKVVVGS
jgi:molecular chaperone GrpE